MGSISAVSSQTFKTYCFRAKAGKKDGGRGEKEDKEAGRGRTWDEKRQRLE